jgi:hypothetical protein
MKGKHWIGIGAAVVILVTAGLWYFDGPPFRQLRLARTWGRLSERLDAIAKEPATEKQETDLRAWLKEAGEFLHEAPERADTVWDATIDKTARQVRLAVIALEALPDASRKDLVLAWFRKAVKERPELGFAALPEEMARATWDKAVASLANENSQVIAVSRRGWLLAHRGQLVVAQGPAKD